jgi:hypothetical protein
VEGNLDADMISLLSLTPGILEGPHINNKILFYSLRLIQTNTLGEA